jgi:hypothetical protein
MELASLHAGVADAEVDAASGWPIRRGAS